jgi:hypothetical protein
MCPANYLTAASRQAMLNDNPSPYSRSLHILVVDDIASMRRVMCSLLRDEFAPYASRKRPTATAR